MMQLDLARKLLPEARELAGLVSEEWSETYNMTDHRAEICVNDRINGEVLPIAIIKSDCSFDDRRLMIKAPVLLRAMVAIIEASFAEIRRLQPPEDQQQAERRARTGEPRPKDHAAECAMKCNDQLFRRFLTEKKGVADVTDGERIAVSVRQLLRVDKRSELNHDAGARNRWLDLRAEFEAWRGHNNG